MKIRKSNASDGQRVLEIWRDAVNATHDFLSQKDRIEIENEVNEFLPKAPLILAVNKYDRPLGFMLISAGHMDALFIDPVFRGRGVGRFLVESALKDFPHLTTDVNEQNSQAVGFYERMGFQRTGRSEKDGQGRNYPLIHLKKM